jgi:hypothetical protein
MEAVDIVNENELHRRTVLWVRRLTASVSS